jgi:hypothetical protein
MTSKRGLGSIRKLPSGRYQVRYTDPNGVRRTARTTFKAKSQAEFELTRIRGAVESGTWHVDETPQAGDAREGARGVGLSIFEMFRPAPGFLPGAP